MKHILLAGKLLVNIPSPEKLVKKEMEIMFKMAIHHLPKQANPYFHPAANSNI